MHVFPQGLDNSLLVAVLIGVLVRLAFNETLGWVFSGLVVPGYLAAVAIVHPSAVAVIALEAAVTYATVRGASVVLGATRLGTPVFGRDRFVWLVVASVGVRLVVEGSLAPELGRLALDVRWDPTGGFGFYGIGLVLVPLVANAMWKSGFGAGSFQLAVVTAITFGATRLLAATTNYSLSQLALSFDRVALDFAGSPKAYLLILGGLVLAARGSLRYGWDTSGVLIPGLLTLGAFTPTRVVGALGEALAVAALAGLVIRLPGVRRWNVEGARRVVFVLTLGCLLKYASLWVAQGFSWHFGDEPWGLGYLLPSLLATRMWQRKDAFVVLLPSLVVPAVALVAVSVVGFGLKQVPALEPELTVAVDAVPSPCEDGTRWSSWPVRAQLLVPAPPSRAAPLLRESDLRAWAALLESLRGHPGRACGQLLEERRLAGQLGLRIDRALDSAGGHWSVISEAGPDPAGLRGLGVTLVADRPAPNALLLGALELDAAWERIDRLEPLALAAQPQVVSLFARPKGRSERADPLQLWRALAAALRLEGLVVRQAPAQSLSGLAPGWLRARLEGALGALARGPSEEGLPVLALDSAALERLAPPAPPPAPFSLWQPVPANAAAGGLPDDTITLAALERALAAPRDGSAVRALGLLERRDALGRRLIVAENEGSSGAVARGAVGAQTGVVEVAGSDRRLIAFGERLQRELGLEWLLVAPGPVPSTPLAQAVRRAGLLNQGPIVTVHSTTQGAVVACVEAPGDDARCSAAARVAAEAGVSVTRQPPYSPLVPGAPSRAGAFARAAGSSEIALWVPPSLLEAPSLPSAGELALFERAGFASRRVSIATELRARCAALRGPGELDWRPLRQFRATHQAGLLQTQARLMAEAGCAPELWLDGEEGLAFAACAGPVALALEAIAEGRGELTARCGDEELVAAPTRRPSHLEVRP